MSDKRRDKQMAKLRKSNINKEVYNVAEIAAMLDINLPAAYKLAKQEDFPAIRIGKRIVIPKTAFSRWLENAGGSQ